MNPEIAELGKLVREESLIERKLDLLKGSCTGREALVLSCGPSLSLLSDDDLERLARGRIVVAVKQAIQRSGRLTDFHLSNFVNFQRFPKHGAISIHQPSHLEGILFRGEREADIILPGVPRVHSSSGAEDLRLMVRKNFEDYLFEKSPERPWGPSILVEVGFYLLLHLGVSDAVVVGWDLGEPGAKRLRHFDEKSFSLQRFLDPIPDTIRKIARRFPKSKLVTSVSRRRFLLHEMLGLKLANYSIPTDENSVIINGAPDFYKWLASKRLPIKLLSSVSRLPQSIPRVTVEEMKTLPGTGQ